MATDWRQPSDRLRPLGRCRVCQRLVPLSDWIQDQGRVILTHAEFQARCEGTGTAALPESDELPADPPPEMDGPL